MVVNNNEEVRDDPVALLERSRTALQRALNAVPVEQRQSRPAQDAWSAAEVLEHLTLVEGAITRLLTRASASVPDDPPPNNPLDLKLVVDRGRRIETGSPSRPTRGLNAEQGWQMLHEIRQQLLALITSVDPAIWSRVRAQHFAFGLLDGLDWIRFVAGHEERHAAQIADIASQLIRRGVASQQDVKDPRESS